MKQKVETLGQRIKRIRGKTYQADFGKRLGVSQGAVSAWERDDKDRLPSADIYFRLAALGSHAEDQAFFLQKAGLSREIIVSAANKLIGHPIVRPKEGDIVLIEPFREEAQGSQEQLPALRLTANLAPDPTSMRYVIVNEDFAGAEVISEFPGDSQDDVLGYLEPPGPQTYPPLIMGDIILLDISKNDAVDLSPFWGHLLLIHVERPPVPRCIVGQIGLMSHLGLVFTARLQLWSTTEAGENIDIGIWRGNVSAEIGDDAKYPLEVYKEAEPQARREIRLHAGYQIAGLVVGWLRPSSERK
jgi:transcriptional regulator with XRE-family HTH domain